MAREVVVAMAREESVVSAETGAGVRAARVELSGGDSVYEL